MVVDGGEWLGSDGSGIPDAESQVTGPTKSGTGTFVSTNGTDTVTVKDSNNQWIDDQNRLGEAFYLRDNITILNVDNTKHVQLQQDIAAAFAAFPNNVAARKASIQQLFVTLRADGTLTDDEINLLESTLET